MSDEMKTYEVEITTRNAQGETATKHAEYKTHGSVSDAATDIGDHTRTCAGVGRWTWIADDK